MLIARRPKAQQAEYFRTDWLPQHPRGTGCVHLGTRGRRGT